MRFSAWSYKELPHISLRVVTDGTITVLYAGMAIMYVYPLRNRILSACFDFTLKPENLRMAVNALRRARGGLDSWVIPALEMSYPQVKERNPDAFNVIPELLASCRGLPVARQWQRVRAQYFKNQGVFPPELPGDTQPVTTQPSKARKTTSRKLPQKASKRTPERNKRGS